MTDEILPVEDDEIIDNGEIVEEEDDAVQKFLHFLEVYQEANGPVEIVELQ